jgi:hypothetical protein
MRAVRCSPFAIRRSSTQLKMDFFSGNIDYSLLTIHYLTAKAAKEAQRRRKEKAGSLKLQAASPLLTEN